jgi:hypothetical protein
VKIWKIDQILKENNEVLWGKETSKNRNKIFKISSLVMAIFTLLKFYSKKYLHFVGEIEPQTIFSNLSFFPTSTGYF